jgi:hypothetical protein
VRVVYEGATGAQGDHKDATVMASQGCRDLGRGHSVNARNDLGFGEVRCQVVYQGPRFARKWDGWRRVQDRLGADPVGDRQSRVGGC